MVAAGGITGGPIAFISRLLAGEVDITVTVEDGTNVTGANSWVSYDDFVDYFENQSRNITSYSEETVEGKLVAAALILTWRYRWCGKKTYSGQTLAFPRTGSYDQDRELVSSTTIPEYVKIAQMELTYWLLVNSGKTGFESDTDQASNEYKEVEIFEAIRIEYKDTQKFKPLPSLITDLVSPCGRFAGSIGTFYIERS